MHDPSIAFAVLDKSIHKGSVKGKVTARELKRMLIRRGSQDGQELMQHELSGEEVEDMVEQADLDGSGTIDYQAFVQYVDAQQKPQEGAEVV